MGLRTKMRVPRNDEDLSPVKRGEVPNNGINANRLNPYPNLVSAAIVPIYAVIRIAALTCNNATDAFRLAAHFFKTKLKFENGSGNSIRANGYARAVKAVRVLENSNGNRNCEVVQFAKGFGFIQPNDGSKDVFVHISAVERAGLSGLNEGQKINYELKEDRMRGKVSAENLSAA